MTHLCGSEHCGTICPSTRSAVLVHFKDVSDAVRLAFQQQPGADIVIPIYHIGPLIVNHCSP
jgi:hypothetical protein